MGFGIDILRLEALKVEVLTQHKHIGHSLVSERNKSRYKRNISPEDLISRLGARIGLENITRLHPAKSNIPEKTYTTLSAAWSEPQKIGQNQNLTDPFNYGRLKSSALQINKPLIGV